MNQRILDQILTKVEKPVRYVGGEWNETVKENAEIRFALCFPDVYEIGMSHLGSRILYNVLNKREQFACERSFAPWPDMEQAMRNADMPLFSLETRRPLKEFDIVGFSLLYEMCYTNILTMLDLSHIPFRSEDRGEDMPLIVCGGPCACNPEPIAPFMDAVMIGDGEEMILEMTETVLRAKKNGEPREAILRQLSRIEGVYVPSLHDGNGGDEPAVTRRIVRDLDAAEFVGRLIVPNMSITHDRVAVEVMRGCTRGCRFCQAGYIYRPVRERKKETLLKEAQRLVDCTGYDEVSLLSLSTGDYSAVRELVPEIIDSMEAQRVSVSLPSLRLDSFLKEELEKMQSIRKSGLTFAPEAGTQRLRDVINKNVTEEDLLRVAGDVFDAGWTSVKLYFMLGLPTETDEDILGIADLARKVSAAFYRLPKEKRGKALRLTVSASTFVPKPFTAFQWCPQVPLDEIRRRQTLLRDALRGIRGVQFQCHLSRLSVLEAAFSRGDRRLADVLEKAYGKGCRFDSWSEHFLPEKWDEAFMECGLSVEQYAQNAPAPGEKLPWSHIDMLVTEQYLRREYERAMKGITTKDCREGCNGCFGGKHADACSLS
ncbi:MAG: TIGR03960 family B12-binding radical SAM protein [Clostridia bacterium]|nr:TIGR03960 family B12-binding radical SAM protein [Clostridia bacterium]